jgi:hypothetical protein
VGRESVHFGYLVPQSPADNPSGRNGGIARAGLNGRSKPEVARISPRGRRLRRPIARI